MEHGLKRIQANPKSQPRLIMIQVRDLRRKIDDHFAPRPVFVAICKDAGTIQYIRVDNDDDTREFYFLNSKPSFVDVLNDMLREEGDPVIVEVSTPDMRVAMWTDEERQAAIEEVCSHPDLLVEMFWETMDPDHKLHEKYKPAHEEFRWCEFERTLMFAFYESDIESHE